MTVLDDYQARLAGMDPDKFIGSILWFSISGQVEREDGRRVQVPEEDLPALRDLGFQTAAELGL